MSIKTRNASMWIQQHCVIRRGERFTFEGLHSTLITTGRDGLDKIMAAIAWADAFEDEINDRQESEHG